MRRGLSTKLVLAVLGAVILPFLGYAYFIDTQIGTRLKENVVRQSLLSLAVDLARQIDRTVRECNGELVLLASDMKGDWAADEAARERQSGEVSAWGAEELARWAVDPDPGAPWAESSQWRREVTAAFDREVRVRELYDLLLLVGLDGRLVTSSTRRPQGGAWGREMFERLLAHDFSGEPWFQRAVEGEFARVDHHRTNLLPAGVLATEDPAAGYHVGFAAPVRRYLHEGEFTGVIYALVNWRHVQALADVPEIKAYFDGLVRDKEPSPYAWIWASDADTILGHPNRELLRERVSGPLIGLSQMVEDARSSKSGHYREYEFGGKEKNAAYHHCRGPDAGALEGGFGWIVGVGIDNEDIYAMSEELRVVLYASIAFVLLLVVLGTMFVAKRTTRPILALQQHTRRVAEGDLDAPPIEVATGDELSDLADDFNEMISELREKRAQLIAAEKDAAWRGMARQIAHDIKNPLTPIRLSIDLLKRARAERSPDTEGILDRTLELVENQVRNLREIATDFYEFTGGRKPDPKPVALSRVVEEVFDLNRAWAEELRVEVRGRDDLPEDAIVRADPMKLQRVLVNLVANAFQSMPDGGVLTIELSVDEARVTLRLLDTGVGLTEEVREHLFEPYFTTRSEGTGLGLAIAKRVVEEAGGTIELFPRTDGESGTEARIVLPRAEAPA